MLRWAAFENDTEGPITEDTVPWPSSAAQLLEDLNAIALAEASGLDCAEPACKAGNSGSERGSGDHGNRRQRACDAAPTVRGGAQCRCDGRIWGGASNGRTRDSDSGCRSVWGRNAAAAAGVAMAVEAAMGRAAFRRAALRWHPDKFAGRYRARVPPEEWPRVLARVQALTQDLTAASAEASEAAARHTGTAGDRRPG